MFRANLAYLRVPTDCGAAALAMALAYHGKEVPLAEIRQVLGVGRNGTKGSALISAGRLYGLRGRSVRVEVENLEALGSGSILYWEFRHYVVLEHVGPNFVRIVDPAGGRRRVPMATLRRAFTGVALIFEPSEAFKPGKTKRKRSWGLLKEVFERWGLLGRILSTSAIVQILSAVMPILTGVLIDRVVPQRNYSLLFLLAACYVVFQLFNALSSFIRAQLLLYLQTQVEASFTLRFLDHLMELPYSYFQQRTADDLMMRLGSNARIKEILTSTTLSTLMDGFMVSLYLILLMVANIPLTLMIIAVAMAQVLVPLLREPLIPRAPHRGPRQHSPTCAFRPPDTGGSSCPAYNRLLPPGCNYFRYVSSSRIAWFLGRSRPLVG